METGLILLSGGKSSRMGKNKALLPVAGKANIERIMDKLHAEFTEKVVVTNQPEEYQHLDTSFSIVSDVFPGLGPLAGIHAGLQATSHETNLIVACDMPFIDLRLARYLLQKSIDYQAVVPQLKGKNQPLFAVYKKSCIPTIEQLLQERLLRVNQLLGNIKVYYLMEEEVPFNINMDRVFFNMNYPEDYDQVKEWINKEE